MDPTSTPTPPTPPTPPAPYPHAQHDPARARSRFRFRWRYLFLACFAALVLFVGALVLSFRTGSELRTLRRAAVEASPGTWHRQFEFGVGRLPVWLAQAGLSWFPMEPEAHAALRCLESADVGVYRHRSGAGTAERDRIFADLRTAMEQEGWEPMVLVRDGRDRVGLFVPAGHSTTDESLRVAVFVLDGSDLVLASVRADLAPLATALLRSSRWSCPVFPRHR